MLVNVRGFRELEAMTYRGSCECRAVTFSVEEPLGPTWACHCSQCRKTSGHYWASTEVPNAQLKLIKDGGLKWYRSSEQARRGFCVACGSSLFWQEDGEDTISVGAGTLDNLPCDATTVVKHIFMADKGAYYDVTDGLPQSDGW